MVLRFFTFGLFLAAAQVAAVVTTSLTLTVATVCTGGTADNGITDCSYGPASDGAKAHVVGTQSSINVDVATAAATNCAALYTAVSFNTGLLNYVPVTAQCHAAQIGGTTHPAYFSSHSSTIPALTVGSPTGVTDTWSVSHTLGLSSSWLPGSADPTPAAVSTDLDALGVFALSVAWNGEIGSSVLVVNSVNIGLPYFTATQAWVTATKTAGQKSNMYISEAVTNFSGAAKTWKSGFRLEHKYKDKGNTITIATDGTVIGATAASVAGQALLAGTMCKELNDEFVGAWTAKSPAGLTALAIRCMDPATNGSVTAADATATLEFATELDMKWAAAYLNQLSTVAVSTQTATAFSISGAASDYSFAISTKMYSQSSTVPVLTSTPTHAAGTYTAKATATKNSGTWEANEACRYVLKNIPRNARHSVWASCESDTAGVMKMAFWHVYDIQMAFRGMSQINLATATSLTKVEPTDFKDGNTTDALGVAISTSVKEYSIRVSNGTAGSFTVASAYSVLTGSSTSSACAYLESILTAATSNIVWCDDKNGSTNPSAETDGNTVDVKFGTDGAAAQLRTLLGQDAAPASYTTTSQDHVALITGASLSSHMYALTYTLVAAASPAVILPAPETAVVATAIQKDPFAVATSGCNWADVGVLGTSKPVWCESTATTMTLWFADAAQAKAGAKLIGALTTRTTIASATPTSAKLKGGSELLQSIQLTSAFAGGQTTVTLTADAATSTDLSGSICAQVTTLDQNHIFCDGKKAAGSTVTLKYLTVADLRTAGKALMAQTTALTPAPATPLLPVYVQLLTPKAGQTYTTTYTVTLPTTGSPAAPTPFTAASVGNVSTGSSACGNYSAATNCIFCVSDAAGGMTMHWVTHDNRTTDGVAISGVGAADPTGITDLTSVTTPAKIITLKYTVKKDTDGKADAWTASDGDRDGSASACLIANGAITTKYAVYCKSLKASGSEMTLKFFKEADALNNARDLRLVKNGTPAAKEVRFAVPVADTLYTATYSLTPAVSVAAVTAVIGPDTVNTDGDGCAFLAGTKTAYCTGDASSVTLYFVGAAARRTDLTATAKKAGNSKIGHVVLDSAKDKDKAGAFITVAYKANNDKGEDFKKAAFNTAVSGSACSKGSGLTAIVSCASVTAHGGTTTWKWISNPDATTADYIADARTLAGLANADKTQIFEVVAAGSTPAVVQATFSTATTTTTKKGRALASAGVGSAASTGGFATANSWCKELGPTAPSAVFCKSDASSATFTHLADVGKETCSLGAADANALTKLTTHYVALEAVFKITIALTVNKSLKADELCSKWKAAGILNVGSCKHASVTIAKARRLAAQSLTVVLGFLTNADLTAANTAYGKIDWAKSFSMVDGTPPAATVTGGTAPSGAPGPATTTAPGPGTTPVTKKPSGAAARLVGVAFLAAFALA